ncbi:NAD-dependent epimerase/dehydratase family protein [Parapedobacter lycopersici]|uniref:NAD-dependent epimerase/dehydratase family protein n=1 Tax=Parapedobacter lycopersici TaxID=1864939 RepID=UPI003340F4F7
MAERIIILGSNGQIGTELVAALRKKYGQAQVVASDIRKPQSADDDTPFELIDVLDRKALHLLFTQYRPTQVYLLAAVLSASGEQHPRQAWDLNINGLLNVLDLSMEYAVKKVFWPSSIAVFGPHSPKTDTPEYCTMDPTTVYGISKLAGERICEYYHNRFGVDVRSIRYPGIISWKAAPGGGTTDYAVHIFHEALEHHTYACFLSADITLPMLYMDDAIRGTLALMDAPADQIRIRSSYNITGTNFSPAMLADAIRRHLPDFTITYVKNDPRQAIADTWPSSINDAEARRDWNWSPRYGLAEITADMIVNLKKTTNGKSI